MRLVGMKEFYNSIKLGDYFFKLTSKNPKEIVEAFLKKPYKTYIDSPISYDINLIELFNKPNFEDFKNNLYIMGSNHEVLRISTEGEVNHSLKVNNKIYENLYIEPDFNIFYNDEPRRTLIFDTLYLILTEQEMLDFIKDCIKSTNLDSSYYTINYEFKSPEEIFEIKKWFFENSPHLDDLNKAIKTAFTTNNQIDMLIRDAYNPNSWVLSYNNTITVPKEEYEELLSNDAMLKLIIEKEINILDLKEALKLNSVEIYNNTYRKKLTDEEFNFFRQRLLKK